jgi:hypothetical protein
MQMNSQLTRRPPAIMAVIAATAFTAAIPMASAIAWKPTYKKNQKLNQGLKGQTVQTDMCKLGKVPIVSLTHVPRPHMSS